ncbi:hypothetical protein BHE74_00034729 [Ensete ventricosum]|nr:hypothetical protein BHE74_00034729 [Ensete ventricosum]
MADGWEYDEDFEEEEVWAVMPETKEASPKARRPEDSSSSRASSSSSAARRLLTGARMIPRSSANSEPSGSSLRRSAPVRIPEWPKVYKHGQRQSFGAHGDEDGLHENVDEEEEEDRRAPPHEWLAKKMARSQISSSSVCEGAGRTLKGRDLSKVRNAVLVKTGFLE